MGRKVQGKHSNSYWDNHHPECSRRLLHIIKNHPLRHFIRRLAYKKGGGERSATGTVLARKREAFSEDKKKNLSLAERRRNSNVEEKVTPHPSVGKNTLRSQIKALIKDISKKRGRHFRSSTHPLLSQSIHTTSTHDLKKDLLSQEIKDKKKGRVKDNARKATSGASNHFCKNFVGSQKTINMNKDLLLAFLRDPASPLVYHFHKPKLYGAEMTLTRSVSLPLPDSSKTQVYKTIGNGSLPRQQGKLYCGNKTQNSVQFESSKKFCEQTMPSVAKWRVNGNSNMNEEMMVRDVNLSSGSAAQGQNQRETKHVKNLKHKIEHVTGESSKEKTRVTMDAVIHKLPQGHGISDDLKKEIFKKLTDPNITREGEHFPKHHRNCITRIWSLQEPLESYFQLHESSFNTEVRHPRSDQLRLRTEKSHSPLRSLTPFHRILSLPDLQSFSYGSQNEEETFDILSLTKTTISSGDGNMSSEIIAYQKKRLDLNDVHSKSQLQLDTPVEDLTQENLVSVDENDLVISNNIVGSGSDCVSKINGNMSKIIDDFGHNSFKKGGTFNDHDIGTITEYKASIAASDSKSKLGPVDGLDNVAEQQKDNMDSLKVTETTENAQKAEIPTKQLNYEIPHFQVDTRDNKAEFNYVKYVLEISGLTGIGSDFLSAWHSGDQPVDPSLYEEMESDPDFCNNNNGGQCNHHVLFDLINETLLEIYDGRSYYYYPPPIHHHTLHQVWNHVSKTLCLRSKAGQKIDDIASRDLAKHEEWVNLQFYAECVGLELEKLIFQDLLEEIMLELPCF